MKGSTGTSMQAFRPFNRGCNILSNKKPSWLGKRDPHQSIHWQQSQYLRRNSANNITLPKLKFMEGEEE